MIFKALLRGVTAVGLIGSLAFTFAPPSATERAALGPDPVRLALVQRRMALILRDYAPAALSDRFAAALDLPPDDMRAALDILIDGPPATDMDAILADLPEFENDPGIRAGGARFVRPDGN